MRRPVRILNLVAGLSLALVARGGAMEDEVVLDRSSLRELQSLARELARAGLEGAVEEVVELSAAAGMAEKDVASLR